MNSHIITNRTVSAGTLTRTAALGLALTNQLLSAAGKSVLPIDNAQLEQIDLHRLHRRCSTGRMVEEQQLHP